jgi:predicted phosphoribosyltransferase
MTAKDKDIAMFLFKDRIDAGKFLAKALHHYQQHADTIVLGLPRGGVPVAYEVAKALALPLDIWLVRKLGVPHHEELAFGALSLGDTYFFNEEIISQLHISKAAMEQVIAKEKQELKRRLERYRPNKPLPELKNKTVILIDDGLATGATTLVAVKALRQHEPTKIVVATPVGSISACEALSQVADEVICPNTPEPFFSVGQWYENFPQTSDEEVQALLK